MMKYSVGQQVWWATCDTVQRFEACPDCGGTGRIRVTFHDETQVSIECANCSAGYNPPTGQIIWRGRLPEVRRITITGFEFTGGTASYHSSIGPNSYYRIDESAIFDTQEDAKVHADKLAAEHNAEEQRRVLAKEKDTRSWAFNASYHRRCIKDAEKKIAYHGSKLNVAALKAKEGDQ